MYELMRREHDDVEKTYEAAVEAYESVRTVQSQLEEQKSQLEEKKEVEKKRPDLHWCCRVCSSGAYRQYQQQCHAYVLGRKAGMAAGK